MHFRTEINIQPSAFRISHQTPILFMGSCFTDNIGSKLKELHFPSQINPFGVVYNPLSVKKNLQLLMEKKEYTPSDLHYHNELWFSWDHHSSFSGPDRDKVLHQINQEIQKSSEMLQKADFLLITFGTAWAYRLKGTNQIVCNCHKIPAKEFERELLQPEEIAREYLPLFESLQKIIPGIRLIFTISPVRHWKDTAHGNQISKASLLLAVEEFQKRLPGQCDYFPAYELLLDDLRDYRFYADDLVHPNQQAIQYIWEQFSNAYFDTETIQINKKLNELVKAAGHKVQFPQTEAHRKFKNAMLKKIQAFQDSYPFIEVGDLKEKFL